MDGARYPAEATLESNGVYTLAGELGVKVLNLSKDELVTCRRLHLIGKRSRHGAEDLARGRRIPSIPRAQDTHHRTVFTGALKNQWGCIPRYDRILLHKHLHELICAVNALRPVTLALMDGLVGMQGRGPINGYPINLNVLLASCDPVALDATAMRLIGLEPTTSQHIVQAERISLGYQSESKIEVDGPFADLQTKVEPGVEDWAIRLMNRVAQSPFLTKHFLLNDGVFYPVRRVVNLGRRFEGRRPTLQPSIR